MAGFSGASGVPKKYVDDLVAQSTAWVNNWIGVPILEYAASVANPSFTTFRTSETSTGVPVKAWYIGYVIRYGQNISVHMTTMDNASRMYINNSNNSGSTWTGWHVYAGTAV